GAGEMCTTSWTASSARRSLRLLRHRRQRRLGERRRRPRDRRVRGEHPALLVEHHRQQRGDEPGAAVLSCLRAREGQAQMIPGWPYSDAAARVPEKAKAAVLAAADQLMQGEWEVLGVL